MEVSIVICTVIRFLGHYHIYPGITLTEISFLLTPTIVKLNLTWYNRVGKTGSLIHAVSAVNGLIRNSAELLGKFKKRALGRSNLRNASKKLKKRSVLRFSKLRNEQYLSLVCHFKIFFIFHS